MRHEEKGYSIEKRLMNWELNPFCELANFSSQSKPSWPINRLSHFARIIILIEM